ncbi:hypothetical protein [Actinophytocola glycyrrhizae]|uniref:Cytochrome P450 n=1 Tax=Actinophytocola glycyrrhizae TaxID=2044873 RepID=A0ABV9S8W5_9PSEU
MTASALTDPAFTMPPVPDGGPRDGIRWLRGTVARFADGQAHQRRRLHVTGMLARADVTALRAAAAAATRAVFDSGHPVDVLAQVAPVVPVEVLAEALDMPPVPVHHVAAAAAAYQPGGDSADAQADNAVAHLVTVFGGVPDESTAARIGVLVQAHTATACLIGNVARTLPRAPGLPADALVARTLRLAPPVRTTRRLDTGTGAVVTVDLAARRLPFGAGPHECPGRDHAVAIAEGVVETLLECPMWTISAGARRSR